MSETRTWESNIGDFDRIADVYVRVTENNAYNALYERPAIRSLLADVSGKRVLDAACAGGAHSAWLAERGARVVAVDISRRMIELARLRVGASVELRQADLRKPLDFLADGSIDIIFSSLTMHYLKHWVPVLAEFHRTLAPSGLFIFSTHHPIADYTWFHRPDYFATELVDQEWLEFGAPIRVPFYRRPLNGVLDALRSTGFALDELLEPQPSAEMADRFPDHYKELCSLPRFLIIRAQRGPSGPGPSGWHKKGAASDYD